MQQGQTLLNRQIVSWRKDWSEKLSQADRFNLFLVATCQGIFCFAAVMLNATIDTAHKSLFYAGGIGLGLLVALASCVALSRIRLRADSSRYGYLYESLLIFDAFYMIFATLVYTVLGTSYSILHALLLVVALATANWALAARSVNLSRQATNPETMPQQLASGLRAIGAVAALPIGLSMAPALAAGDRIIPKLIVVVVAGLVLAVMPSRLFRKAYQFLPWIGALLVALFLIDVLATDSAYLVMAATAAALVILRFVPDRETGPVAKRAGFSWRDFAALALIFALTIDIGFSNDRHHYDAHLGAINDMLHGKTLLVDSISQYGWLVTYAIAGIFASHIIPISYSGFSLIISLMIGSVLSIVYLLLRLTVNSMRISLVAMLVIIVAYVWQATVPMTVFPSTGPIRFLWLYALMGVWGWEYYHSGSKRWLSALKHVILILGIAWGLDSAFFCLALYTAVTVFQISISGSGIRRRTLLQIAIVCVDIAITFGAIYLITYLKSGQWPDWRSNIEFIVYYPTSSPVYLASFFFFSRWLIVACIYLISLLLIALKWLASADRQGLSRYTLAFGMTVLGLLQFAYWVGNSTIITAQLAPAIFLVVFWHSEFVSGNFQKNIRQGIRFFVYTFGLYYLMTGVYLLVSSTNPANPVSPTVYTVAHLALQPVVGGLRGEAPWNLIGEWNKRPTLFYSYPYLDDDGSAVPPAVRLINRYAPDKDRVALLIPPDSTIETLIAVNKANVFQLDDALIDSLSPSATLRALEPVSSLWAGDLVFAMQDFKLLLPLQQQIIRNLCQQFRLTPVEVSEGIAVMKLGALPGQPGDCVCQAEGLTCPSH